MFELQQILCQEIFWLKIIFITAFLELFLLIAYRFLSEKSRQKDLFDISKKQPIDLKNERFISTCFKVDWKDPNGNHVYVTIGFSKKNLEGMKSGDSFFAKKFFGDKELEPGNLFQIIETDSGDLILQEIKSEQFAGKKIK